jgi:hypothetical protein
MYFHLLFHPIIIFTVESEQSGSYMHVVVLFLQILW